MGIPVILTVQLAAADADGIAQSQALASAGNLTLNGALVTAGVAILASAGAGRQVILTSGGNDTGVVFTVYGTNPTGNSQTEQITGASGGVATGLLPFLTVTRIAASAAVATTITAGTNGVGYSRWANVNIHAQPVNIAIGCVVSGTVDYDVEYTYDNLNATTDQGVLIQPTSWTDPIIDGATATADTTFSLPISGWRVKMNSGTGTVTATGIQAGLVGG